MIGKSIWQVTTNPQLSFPKLKGDVAVDVAIIGAGISGLTCAYHLVKAGKKVALIEAGKIGLGTTGRSTGNLYVLVDQHLSALKSKWGEEKTKRIVRARSSAIESIERTSRELQIDCEFKRCSFFYFTENGSSESKKFFTEESDTMRSLGIESFEHQSTSLPFQTRGALEIANQAQFHPLKYAVGLANSISDRVRIYEDSPVIDYNLKENVLFCPEGKVHFSKVVFATHTPKGVWGVQMKLAPIREHGVAAPLNGKAFPGTFWRVDQPKRSVRTVSDGTRSYVLVIGDKFKTGHNSDTQKENEILSKYLAEHFNVTNERFWWGAQSYRSADKIPYIGQLEGNSYYLTGFSTDGLVYGTLGAQIIADEILGNENPWASLFAPESHSLFKSLGTLAKEGADNFYQYAKDLPKVGTASPEEISPGEGKIIEHEGEKWAVYCDEAGGKHAVSAVCTHMKCIVSFNNAEKTWDCPCHASRFRTDGTVIEGPAIHPLERKNYEDTELIDRTVRGGRLSGSLPSQRSFPGKRDS